MTNAQRDQLIENRKKDSKAPWLIWKRIEDPIFPNVATKDYAKKA